MSDVRTAADPDEPGAAVPRGVVARRGPAAPLSEDSALAVEIRGLVERGEMDEARDRFGELLAMHQRRASRIAYQYLRDASDADEAVQDAFLKVFSHIGAYREACAPTGGTRRPPGSVPEEERAPDRDSAGQTTPEW